MHANARHPKTHYDTTVQNVTCEGFDVVYESNITYYNTSAVLQWMAFDNSQGRIGEVIYYTER
jgi:hypothetical protein